MKNLFVLLLLSLTLFGCSSEEDNDTVVENAQDTKIDQKIIDSKVTDFIIETKNLKDFDNSYSIEKSGKVLGTQVIDIKSQSAGDISNIYVKEGDNVYVGQKIASIKDNFSSKSLSLEKSKINLEKSKISYDSKVISLQKTIDDAKLNLDKIKKDLVIEKAKLEQDLIKAKLDYVDNISGDNDKITGYIDSVKKEYLDLKIYLYDLIDFSDKLLGVTDENDDLNNSFENYLGAKNTTLKTQTENNLKELITYSNNFKSLDLNIDKNNILDFLSNFEHAYTLTTTLLDNIELTLNSSVVSTSLTQNTIDSYISSVNSKQSSNLSNYSGYLSLKSNVTTFLNTYKESDEVIVIGSDLLDGSTADEVTYNKTILTIKDSINTLENQLESAKLSYENAIKNKDVSLLSAKNEIDSAQNSYDSALQEFSKLVIYSPISGVVSSVNVDVASYVGVGNTIISVVGDKNTKVELTVSKEEKDLFIVGDIVKVDYNGTVLSGKIESIGAVADANLNYKVIISLKDKIISTGGIARVIFDVKLADKMLLPIDIVNIIGGNIGTINLYIDGKIKELKVALGKVYADKIMIKGKYNSNNEIVLFEGDPEIILTNMDKYNPDKNNLVKKGEQVKPSTDEKSINNSSEAKEVSTETKQVDISSMTPEERKAYMSTLSDEEKEKLKASMN